MALYTVTQEHPLITPRVATLTPQQFAAHVVKAEALLGLVAPPLTEASAIERLTIAVVEQINFQVQQGLDPLIEHSSGTSSQASQSVVWRDRYLNPAAAALVALVIPPMANGQWTGTGLQSRRTNDGGGHSVRANGGVYRWPGWLR